MNRTEDRIQELFIKLDNWRQLPAYQLERRADIFFALYLDRILEPTFKGHRFDLVIPEFPVRLGSINEAMPKNGNRSVKVDYACFDSQKKLCVLVELKTDNGSMRDVQFELMREAQRKGLDALLRGIVALRNASKSKRKYDALLRQFIKARLMTVGSDLRRVHVQPAIGVAEHEVRLAIIQPKAKGVYPFESIGFDQVRERIQPLAVDDIIAHHFCKALEKWRTAP